MKKYTDAILKNAFLYKMKSVFVKNFISCALIILLPIIIMNIGFYLLYSNSLNITYKNINNTNLLQCSNAIESTLSGVTSSTARILNNQSLLNLLNIDSKTLSQSFYKKFTSNVQQLLNEIPLTEKYVDSVYTYSSLNDCIITKYGTCFKDNFYDKKLINQLIKDKNQKTKIIPHKIDMVGLKTNVLSYVTPIYPNHKESGYIIVNISYDYISSVIDNVLKNYPYDVFVIKDSSDNIIYSSGSTDNNDKNIRYHETSLLSKNSDLKFTLLISDTVYNLQKRRMILFIIIFGFFSIILTILLSLFLSVNTSRPIGSILDIVEHPDKWADYQQLAQSTPQNEMKYIVTNILNTFNMNKAINEQASIRAALLKKAQAIALQTQINPHFLFNTLNTINLSALELTNSENETSQMITTLSDFLRLSFQTKEILLTINQEKELLEKYFQIQKCRFGDMFDVKWDIDSSLLNYKIIKLSTQPIVENAISHGIKPSKKKCFISIGIHLSDNDDIIIVISNNGIPIEKEKLEDINKKLESTDIFENENIGITNVHQRIRLTFGEPYGIIISSNDELTEFKLTFPKIL